MQIAAGRRIHAALTVAWRSRHAAGSSFNVANSWKLGFRSQLGLILDVGAIVRALDHQRWGWA
jgi:hypothetical protein